MHALTRILLLISLIMFASQLTLQLLSAFVASVLLISLFIPKFKFVDFMLYIKRMRFLLLSIAILFFWFTPGQLLWPPWHDFSPSVEGLSLGSQRMLLLVFIGWLVYLLLLLTSRQQLVYGIYLSVYPAKFLGFQAEKFALRLLLTLEYFQAPLLEKQTPTVSHPKGFRQRLQIISDQLYGYFESAFNHQVEKPREILLQPTRPRWYEWLLLMVLPLLSLWV
ncbi:MAG: energy-coupling factor transporter transmembrane protein EcfT [Gammaproteobacteria bacterium]|nr:energy-coupling factor transporter transmembrane protein EcfT [Gammaproteobacteria bacterium]MDH5731165.1 energy-coupling factor transporter transmembrane protein EcfT [Gammaproteobacteria bacterium]